MPSSDYTVGTFLGGLVRSFSSSIGWGIGNVGQLSVQIVDDPVQNAYFSAPEVGTPVYFSFYQLSFNGIFQKWEKKRGVDGNPVYEVIVSDPREILDGAQLILNSYNGSVGGVRNLYNLYGYWENLGYGGSLANDSGMTWNKIRDGLNAICNSATYGAFGGPLTFRGNTYSLDLSQLPVVPANYRIGGGVSIGLLEAISQICEDSGCDFFVELVGYTIRIRTASRVVQPPLGTINAITESNYATSLIRSTNGLELRNELTSSFLVGGEITSLNVTSSLNQFWGYDIDGNPLTSTPVSVKFYREGGNPIFGTPPIATIATDLVNLNASPIADIIGRTYYPCYTLEMRLAQSNYESWAFWMVKHRRDMANIIGLTSPFFTSLLDGALNGEIRANFINDEKLSVDATTADAIATDFQARSMRVYEFVKGIADEYMGRKYIVGLPFILSKTDTETLQVTTSYEITDAGYVLEGATSFGLSPLNEEVFKNQDGRFTSFCVFDGIDGADLSKISPNGTVIENDSLYMSVQIDSRIILYNSIPCVIATLNGPLSEQSVDNVGGLDIIAAVLQLSEENAQKHLQQCPIPLKTVPAIRNPVLIAVPLKSNVLTYGPWYASGAAGKVRIEYDPSLAPWNYGGYSLMNEAANSRVVSSVTNMQIAETGNIELVGPPTTSIGETLYAGGPNITNIDVSMGTEGVTTSYRFQTFTPKFGQMSKGMGERLKRFASANLQLRKALRASVNEQIIRADTIGNAERTARAWNKSQAKAYKRETPHDCLMAYSCFDGEDNSVRQNVHSLTMEESIVLSNSNKEIEYKNTAIMSMNGLFRPFTTSPSASGLIPKLTSPSITSGPHKDILTPFKSFSDIEAYSYGSEYNGLHAYRRRGDFTNARALGLRSPVILVGWGLATDTKCVPSTSGDGTSWDHDHNYRQDKWKAGPLDCLWDEKRGVWSVHDALKGITGTEIAAGGSGTVSVRPLVGTNYNLSVYNWFSSKVNNNTKVICNYIATDNRWYVVAADCV